MDIKSLIEAIYDGGAVMRDGNYTLGLDDAIDCAKMFMEGRETIFKEVDKATWSIWDAENFSRHGPCQILETDEYNQLVALYKDEKIAAIVDYPDSYLDRISSMHNRYLRSISYEARRVAANSAINKKQTRLDVMLKSGWKCCICGSTDRLGVDHIVSVANGGGNELDNLQALCVSCNSKKGSR